jgi:ornithine cyclodeaminase/alanine dehydrogenase-like protein (mu-crystallin family)
MIELRLISAVLIDELSSQAELYEWVKESLIETSKGNAVLPLRQALQISPELGAIGMMPGYLASAKAAGVKLVSLAPPERRRGSSHLGLMVLYDEDGLLPVALLDGARVTAIRTAAASAVATDALARKDAKILTIIGTGEQAESHAIALSQIRSFEEIRICGRSASKAQQLTTKLTSLLSLSCKATTDTKEAVNTADVICTVTAASEPLLMGAWVKPGTHINLVGSSQAAAREADTELLTGSKIFLDYDASAQAQAGEIMHAVGTGDLCWEDIQGEIGLVLTGTIKGRESNEETTVYKSLGIAAQDIITAKKIFGKAEKTDRGQLVTL